MGSEAGHSWEKPPHRVSVPGYRIGARPISNGEYRAFRPSHHSPRNDDDAHPVTGISWHEASDYCAWLSAQTERPFSLPPEAWWERAVRGGLIEQDYPWGDRPGDSSREDSNATPVPNAYGVSAVGYNLWEWTGDWYAADYYGRSPANDPRGPETGEFKVLRGGGYRDDPGSATTFTRGSARPETRSEHITFRVAEAVGGAPVQVSETRPSSPTTARPRAAPPKTAPPKAAPARTPTRPTRPAAPATKPSETAAGPVRLTDIEIIFPASGPQIRLTTTGRPDVKAFGLSNPARLVCDLRGAKMGLSPMVGEVEGGRAGVTRVRYSLFQLDPPIVRIVVDLERLRPYEIDVTDSGVVIRFQP